MKKLKDIYKREINIGDYVLVGSSNVVESSTYLTISNCVIARLAPDGHFYDSRNKKILHTDYTKDGDYISKVYPKLFYKLETREIDLFQFYNMGKYDVIECMDNHNKNCNIVDGKYEYVNHIIQIRDIFDRELNLGDFVLYKMSKTKANYGLVVGKREVRTQSNGIECFSEVFKITYPNIEEEKIYKELVSKQKQLERLSLLKKNKEPYKVGNIYLNKTQKLMYLYIGNCTLVAKSSVEQKIHPTSDIVLEFDIKNVKSGKLFENILQENQITMEDIKKAFNKSPSGIGGFDKVFRKSNYKRMKNINDISKTSLYYLFGQVDINEPLEVYTEKNSNDEIKVILTI